MRKISLTNGALTVEILPDCGGAISAFRWMDSHNRPFDLLRIADAPPCIPLTLFALPDSSGPHPRAANGLFADLAEWTVQDASNIRATLTLHREMPAEPGGGVSHYQLLQRFELGPEGLRIQFTITNIGVRSIPAEAGLRLRPDMRGVGRVRGVAPLIEMMPGTDNAVSRWTPAGLAAGYRLGEQELHVMLGHVRRDIRYEWPDDRLALVVAPLQGFDFIGLDYYPAQTEFWLTLMSHMPDAGAGITDTNMLQQGDSLSAALLLSAVPLAV